MRRRWPSGGHSWNSATRPSGGREVGVPGGGGVPVLAAQRPHGRARPGRPAGRSVTGDVGGAVGGVDLLLPLAGGRFRSAGRGAADARGTAPGTGPRPAGASGRSLGTGPVVAGAGARSTAARGRPPLLLPKEIQAILDGCAVFDTGDRVSGSGNLRDRLLFALLAETGIRLGEALGLRISDFVMGRGGTPYVEIVPARRQRERGAGEDDAPPPGLRRQRPGAVVRRLPDPTGLHAQASWGSR